MDRKTFLKKLDLSRQLWEDSVKKVRDKKLQDAKINEKWTAKDLIVHVIWFEKEMVQLIRERSLEKASPFWQKAPDERNHLIYEANQNRLWDDIMNEFDSVYSQLRKAFSQLSDDEFNDFSQFGMPSNWVPHTIFADNTYKHYDHHMPELQAIMT